MAKSYHDELVERFGVGQLMHFYGSRDEQGELILLDWYVSGEGQPRKVNAFQVDLAVDSETDTLAEHETAQRVERTTFMVSRVGDDGRDVPLDTEALVIIPGETVWSGRWGVDRIGPADANLAQVTLIREKPKRHYGTGYER